MANILDDLGISQEELNQGEASTIVKPFEALKSGVYTAEVKSVHAYKNQWDGSQMKYVVEVKDESGEPRLISFRTDIGKTLKDGSANKGYAGRLKQFSHACNVPIGDLTTGPEETIKIFGKDTKANTIVGFNGKVLKALVRHTNDTNKEEGAKFKYTNDLQGVVAPDGTEEGGENGAEKFVENAKKTPIFTVQGKQKAAAATTATTTASGADINSML